MKKLIIIIIVIVSTLLISDYLYKEYSRNFINSHEAIILINNTISGNEIEYFFELDSGRYNTDIHEIIFTLERKEASILDPFINLPVKHLNSHQNSQEFDCDIEYQQIRSFRFYKYEIGNKYIIARLINTRDSQSHSKKIIAQKYLISDYNFGEISIFDINKNGIHKRCQ